MPLWPKFGSWPPRRLTTNNLRIIKKSVTSAMTSKLSVHKASAVDKPSGYKNPGVFTAFAILFTELDFRYENLPGSLSDSRQVSKSSLASLGEIDCETGRKTERVVVFFYCRFKLNIHTSRLMLSSSHPHMQTQ